MSKKILVTGGAGFIGSHITDSYIKAGHKVIVIDNLSTGSLNNLNKKARFYKADLTNHSLIKKILNKEKPEIINHHAAIASVVASDTNSLKTYQTNVIGTLNLLLANSSIKQFIFASTGGAIYGETTKPALETDLVNPMSPYGLSKQLAEEIIQFYAKENNFSYLIFRYSNVFGPRQGSKSGAGVVPIFMHLMNQGKRPTIYNEKASRDYIYIIDVTQANLKAIKGIKNEIINLGSSKRITNKQVFLEIAKLYNFSKKPIYRQRRKGEIEHSCLSFKKAKRLLNWRPSIDFKTGIKLIYNAKKTEG